MVRLKIPTLLIISIIVFGTATSQVNHIMVQVSFNECIDTTGFADPNNFIWSGGLVTTDVELIDTALAVLTVSMPVYNQWYSLEVFNVYDLAGNLINPEQDTTGFMWFGSLPVELNSFTAQIIDEGVKLIWKTETEVNNYGFEVERQISSEQLTADNWKKITFVEGHGNSNSPKEYNFLDEGISYGTYAYRLKQIDNDGTFEYSDVIEVNAGDIPEGFVLEQNYPNPFNPTTVIKFALAESQQATLTVYDILGNEVAQLFNKITEAGKVYKIEFGASDLSSGVYYYRLSTPQKSLVRKMLLLQ